MKRTLAVGDFTATTQYTPFEWPSMAPTVLCDRIKEAVTAACYTNGPSESYLPRQPIMLYCLGEDVSCHMTLVYWPRDIETGVALLRRLVDTKTEASIDTHCELVEALIDVACGAVRDRVTESEAHKKSRLLKESAIITINGLKPWELGLLAIIRDNDYKGLEPDPPHIGAHYIQTSELATHLYYQECLRFM